MAVVVVAKKATASAKLNCIKEGGLSGRVGQKGVGWASCYLILPVEKRKGRSVV